MEQRLCDISLSSWAEIMSLEIAQAEVWIIARSWASAAIKSSQINLDAVNYIYHSLHLHMLSIYGECKLYLGLFNSLTTASYVSYL